MADFYRQSPSGPRLPPPERVRSSGGVYFSASGETVYPGLNTPVALVLQTVSSNPLNVNFDSPSNGVLRCLDPVPRTYLLIATLSIRKPVPGNDVLIFSIAKNGQVNPRSLIPREFSGTDTGSITLSERETLKAGDTVQAFGEWTSGAENITCLGFNLTATEV